MAASKTPAPRVLWKGAISFGLVHIPVALYSATVDHSIDFDWLDKRTMDPVGYKRVNKKTGREIAREQIVKGVEYENGQYVVLSDKEIADAYPKTTQTIEIESFAHASEIAFTLLEKPFARLTAVMFTPASAASDSSVTLPPMAPVVTPCAPASALTLPAMNAANATPTRS